MCVIYRVLTCLLILSPAERPGKSETYLEAIRKNIEWLKKHNKEEGKDGEIKLEKSHSSERVNDGFRTTVPGPQAGNTVRPRESTGGFCLL